MPSFSYEYVTTYERACAVAAEIVQAEVIPLDTETTSLSPYDGKVRLLSLNTGKNIYVLDFFLIPDVSPIIDALRRTKAIFVLQNAKFDCKFLLHHYNLELWPVFDTFRASNLIYNGKNLKHDLWSLYARELGIAPETQDLGGSNWAGTLTKEQIDYSAEDAVHLGKLRIVLKEKLRDMGLLRIALLEFGAITPEAAMELKGFYFDKERWLALAEANAKQESRLRRELMYDLPHPAKQCSLPGFDPDFNLQSPKQLLTSLQMLGLKVLDTNEMTLAMFADEYPIVDKLLDYRGYAQAIKTFGPDYLENVNPKTGRIHTNYYPFTGAGRYSSSGPNLQQVPRVLNGDKRRLPWEFRDCLRAPTGRKLIIRDYSQIELRIASEISNDDTLMGVYVRGEDAHALTASLVANVPLSEVTKGQRQMAKAVNFGLVYGMSAKKLVIYAKGTYRVKMDLAQAELFRKRYFEAYSGVYSWHQRIFSDENRRSGMIRTPLGRLRFLPQESYNEYSNSPVQGGGADGLKLALRACYERLRKYGDDAAMIAMVHDEIVAECKDDPELIKAVDNDIEEGMREGMENVIRKVPVITEGGAANTWADK